MIFIPIKYLFLVNVAFIIVIVLINILFQKNIFLILTSYYWITEINKINNLLFIVQKNIVNNSGSKQQNNSGPKLDPCSANNTIRNGK